MITDLSSHASAYFVDDLRVSLKCMQIRNNMAHYLVINKSWNMTPNETNVRNIDLILYKANIAKAFSYIELRSTNNFIASMHFILRT